MKPDDTSPTTSPPVGVRDVRLSERPGASSARPLLDPVPPDGAPKLCAEYAGDSVAERVAVRNLVASDRHVSSPGLTPHFEN